MLLPRRQLRQGRRAHFHMQNMAGVAAEVREHGTALECRLPPAPRERQRQAHQHAGVTQACPALRTPIRTRSRPCLPAPLVTELQRAPLLQARESQPLMLGKYAAEKSCQANYRLRSLQIVFGNDLLNEFGVHLQQDVSKQNF